MAAIPWDSLVSVSVGGLLTFGSTMLTQRYAARRADAARSYEHRREVYVDFVKEFQARWNELTLIGITKGLADFEPSFDFLDALYDRLVQIKIFGSKEAANRAQKALSVLWGGVFNGEMVPNDVLAPLQSEIRRDLSIPDRSR